VSDEDSTMITPPPGIVTPKVNQAEPAADVVEVDPETFITLPPGVLDSGTYRVANPRVVPQRSGHSKDDIVFFPTAPGVVATPSPVGAPSKQPKTADESRSGRVVQQWCLVLPGGVGAKAVRGALFIGRNPARTRDWPVAELLPIIDPAKSLSKTHALLEVEADVLWVHDLDSTNGVFIVAQNGDTVEVKPGTRAAVPADSQLELGEYVIQIEHS
jgi:hypothetical protein